MKLSILICSVKKRLTQFAMLAGHLEKQAQNKPVEILWLGDNKTMSVGEKRNKLLSISEGDYVAFVDDDDWVADDYVDEILKGIEKKPDCVTFNAIYSTDEGETIPVEYSVNNILNVDEPNKPRLRVPNHLIPMKREFALATMFLEKNFGEDTDYGLRVRRLLKTEHKIEKPLYYYRFSFVNSETHKYSPRFAINNSKFKIKNSPPVVMDVVMVSDTTAAPPQPSPLGRENSSMKHNVLPEMVDMTQQAINSLFPLTGGSRGADINVVVLEKANNIQYAHADTFLQREPFNYNQCLNNGAIMGNAEFICFTNNDVLFPKGFANRVVEEMREKNLDTLSVLNQHGYCHPSIISGFCFVMRRSAWLKIGKLNTDYRFWCADNVTSEQIKQHHLREGRSDIKVFHGTSVTLNKLDAETREEYTRTCVRQFNHDYDKNVLNLGK
ncbi:MAG TPA: glycosyltransferase [Bacteroidia bacterium]|jgi:hypothetical protein|nr:glycosyltransferase [Bacteroidia bacterium]